MTLEEKMKELEYFSQFTIPEGMWTVVRLDGNKFSKFTKRMNYKKPFDIKFQDLMVETAKYVMENTGGIFTETHSDEISILYSKPWDYFNRRAEKITSIASGMASSKFTQLSGELVQFDGRIWMAAEDDKVLSYYKWRQDDANRNAIHGYCFYKLIEEGNSPTKATSLLQNKDRAWKNEFLFERGINYNDLPSWQKRGVGIYWQSFSKVGYNPLTKEEVPCFRRELIAKYDIPMKQEYQNLIRKIMEEKQLSLV